MKCDTKCMYFPQEPNEVVREYTDSQGVKHREAIFKCWYDRHKIINFVDCPHYKTMIKEAKKNGTNHNS